MNYLLDTHILLWSLFEPDNLFDLHKSILENPDHNKFISSVNLWEISLKYSLGKLDLQGINPEGILKSTLEAGFHLLELKSLEAVSSYQLPFVKGHRDPFDRLLVWQCIRNDMVLLTADKRIQEYQQFGHKLTL